MLPFLPTGNMRKPKVFIRKPNAFSCFLRYKIGTLTLG